MNYLRHRELLDKLAAEYVLGTLRGGAARRFARLAGDNATVRVLVEEWETRLTLLAAPVAERAPHARVWQAIAARIAFGGGRAAVTTTANRGIWSSLAFWRGLGVLGSAAAVALFAVLMMRPPELIEVQVPIDVVRYLPPKAETPPSYLAVLEDPKTHKPVLLALAARYSDQLMVKPIDVRALPADKDLQLWALPEGAKPRSLGVVGAIDKSMIKLASASENELGSIPMLAISLEPKGGSPTGDPTGPVLYTGKCMKLW
jgi:anti-sigma-K factor RskA